MASRRLDISSLLCDDNQPPFSPLDALVAAATEERKRLDAVPASTPQPPPPQPQLSTHIPPRHHYEHDHRQQQLELQQQQQLQYQQAHELELRNYDIERRRRIQQAEIAQQQQRAQHLEFQRQQQERDRLNLLRAQELGRRHREEEEERRRYEQYERQIHEQREYDRLQEERIREERLREMEHIKREEHRELERLRELERREIIERRERADRDRQQREVAERHLELERRREQDRIDDIRRRQQLQLDHHHRFLESQSQPIATTPHPPSISHLISHSPPPRKPDPPQVSSLPISIPLDPPTIVIPSTSHEDPRPIKKPRYSESPTRPISDDKERIARERDKMSVGELGYGRVESPSAGPSLLPRRPGSGHGHVRKPVAVSDLLVDKERAPAARSQSRDRDAHRVVSPLGGRRSPPGSQIGRAKAARKSDDYLLREPLPQPVHQVVHIPLEPEPKKVKDEPKLRAEPKPPRPRPSSDGVRSAVVDEVKPKKVPTKETPLPAPPLPSKSQQQQDDAHEWFLQQYDEEPSPTMSSRHEPPHTPSPSASPVTPNHPAPSTIQPSVKSPPSSHRALTPITAAVSLEEELEELVSKPVSIAASFPPPAIIKRQEAAHDMDLDVDLAVTELVDTLEEGDGDVKHEPSNMEVDVEDELLSLVDDRPPPPPVSSSAPSVVRRAAGPSATISNSAPTHVSGATIASVPLPHPHPHSHTPSAVTAKQQPIDSKLPVEARQVSPLPTMTSTFSTTSLNASRHPSTRPTSERGSMPPPASTSVGAKKGSERASSIAPTSSATSTYGTSVAGITPAPKKKKESATKAAATKAKASTGAGTSGAAMSASTSAKPRAKPAAKAKKGGAAAAAADSVAMPTASATPSTSSKSSKPSGTTAANKHASSASRSRSTSAMPTGSASVGPESDVKAEKQEEEEDSDCAANDDDKLYCVCKTKYDEDRFMIACDRCDEWYHTNCLHMSDLEVDLVDQFICPPCVEKNPHLNLRTTYKQRCLYGLRHPDTNSPRACHKAARGAFSKYCSDECGVKYMQSRIDNWAKKGGKTEKLWDSVKNADKREGVVCTVEIEEEETEEGPETNGDTNGCATAEDEDKADVDTEPSKQQHQPQKQKQKNHHIKQHLVPPTKTKIGRETERLNGILDSVIKLREEIKRGMEIVVWREQLLQLASERAEMVDQCGWDQRLCMDDQEWEDLGASVLESYEDLALKAEAAKEDGEGDMEVDDQWWCPGNKVCDRHQGWQTVRYKDVTKEKEKKEEALAKLTTREREIRKRIEDMLDPHNTNNPTTTPATITAMKETTASHAPLKASNTRSTNGHPKAKAAASAGDTAKKGKKRKAPAS